MTPEKSQLKIKRIKRIMNRDFRNWLDGLLGKMKSGLFEKEAIEDCINEKLYQLKNQIRGLGGRKDG